MGMKPGSWCRSVLPERPGHRRTSTYLIVIFIACRTRLELGPSIGRWARPDFIVITAMRFKLMPMAQIEVHSFEPRTETGATDLAVYEALAQLALLISEISSGICPRAPVPKIDLWKSKSSVTNMGSD